MFKTSLRGVFTNWYYIYRSLSFKSFNVFNTMMNKAAWWLMWIGALNWGLVGVGGFFGSNWNVVNLLFGGIPTLEFIVYLLVGLAAVYSVCMCSDCGKSCKDCKSGRCSTHGKGMNSDSGMGM
jgi:uncharacterized membrane protein YuzA (DUF378 family)